MEFWEVLISTLSGFVIAFFAEPIKTYLSNRSKKAQLRASLYREMFYLYSGFNGLLQKIDVGVVRVDQISANRETLLRFDCYDYAKSDHSVVLFYQLKEANHIDIVYKNFKLVYSDVLKTDEVRKPYAEAATKVFEQKVANDEIDGVLLRKVGWRGDSNPPFIESVSKEKATKGGI